MNEKFSGVVSEGISSRGIEFDLRNEPNPRGGALLMHKKKMASGAIHSSSRGNKTDESQLHSSMSCNLYNSPNVMYNSLPPTASPAMCKLHYGNNASNQYHLFSSKKYINSCNEQYEAEACYNNYCNEDPQAYFVQKSTGVATNSHLQSSNVVPGRSPPSNRRIFLQKQSQQSFLHEAVTGSSTASTAQITHQTPSTPQISETGSHSNGNSTELNRNLSSTVSEINIRLRNNVVVCLEIENPSTVTCRDLINMMIEEPEVGLEDGDMFALWMISSHFEVQLKPDHKPFNVWKKWPYLLAKYTNASEQEREKDCPYLRFQRDVFSSKRLEMKLGNCLALELLYEEAKSNILCGRYPCDQNNAIRLASIQARIELGKYDPEVHTPEFFKSRLSLLLPASACKSKWSILNFGSKSGMEYRLLQQYRAFPDDVSHHQLIRQYMDI